MYLIYGKKIPDSVVVRESAVSATHDVEGCQVPSGEIQRSEKL
jgi:hypothetical protein